MNTMTAPLVYNDKYTYRVKLTIMKHEGSSIKPYDFGVIIDTAFPERLFYLINEHVQKFQKAFTKSLGTQGSIYQYVMSVQRGEKYTGMAEGIIYRKLYSMTLEQGEFC